MQSWDEWMYQKVSKQFLHMIVQNRSVNFCKISSYEDEPGDVGQRQKGRAA